MSNWQNNLDLRDLWKAFYDETMTTSEIAKEVAKRIRAMKCYMDYEDDLDSIADEFESCKDDRDEFNGILAELYDWADISLPTPKGQMQKKICWIATLF